MTKKIYIAGPVSGREPAEAEAAFQALERALVRQGHQVVNPVEELQCVNLRRRMQGLPLYEDGIHRREILHLCVSWLARCDELHLLPGWQFSEGACIEHKVAALLKMKIVYPD